MVDLIALSIRHQVLVEGLKAAQGANLVAALSQLQNLMKARLNDLDYDELGDLTKKELNKLLMDLRAMSKKVFNTYLDNLIKWLSDYINADRSFWCNAYAQAKVDNSDNDQKKSHWFGLFTSGDDADAIMATANKTPMGANGILPMDFLNGFGTSIGVSASRLAMQAYVNNDKKKVLIDQILGAPNTGNANLMRKLNAQGRSVTNTIIQHMAAQTNLSVAELGYQYYLWVSVLDNATTQICRSRDGNVYTYGEGPLPPAHVGCRSSTIAWDGATGPTRMPTFNMWAKGQSQQFVNLAFDGNLSSQYEGTRPMTLDQFVKAEQLIIG